jgi:CHAT domain-containing protein
MEAFLTFILDVDKQFTKPLDVKDRVPASPDVTEMQSALRNLGVATNQKAATVYTLIGTGRERLYLLLVTADQIKVFESPIDVKQFRAKVWQFYALLQSPNYDPRVLGQELYGIIFKPIEEEVKNGGIQTLMWSLAGC